jgi:hypothetical protein
MAEDSQWQGGRIRNRERGSDAAKENAAGRKADRNRELD